MSGDSVDQGADVRRRREALGLSRSQLAHEARVDLGTVKNWEEGRTRHPRQGMAVLAALARLETAGGVPGSPVTASAVVSEDITISWAPGVSVTVHASDAATVGDVRRLVEELRRLREQAHGREQGDTPG